MNELAINQAVDMVRRATEACDTAKAWLAEAQTKLADLVRDDAVRMLEAKGKQAGEVTIEVAGHKLTAAVDKSVTWDSAKLLSVASGMPWADAQRVFKFTASVPETVFNSITDAGLREQLTAARTVKYSPLKVKLKD